MAIFLRRAIGAALLDRRAYDEVEADHQATPTDRQLYFVTRERNG